MRCRALTSRSKPGKIEMKVNGWTHSSFVHFRRMVVAGNELAYGVMHFYDYGKCDNTQYWKQNVNTMDGVDSGNRLFERDWL